MIARKTTIVTLVVCVLLVTLTPPVSGAADDAYVIDMRVGDTFSYQPETNMDSVISVLHGVDGAVWDVTTGTLKASFDDVYNSDLNRQVVLKAVWTAPDAPDLTQTAFQGISFRTYGYLDVDGQRDHTKVLSVPVGTKAGDVVYTPAIRTADPSTTNTVSCTLPDNPYLRWDSAYNRIVAASDVISDVVDDVSFQIVVTNTHDDPDSTLRSDSVTVSVNAYMGSGLVITSPDSLESHVGFTDPSQNRYTVTTNMDGVEGADVTPTFTPPADAPEGFITINQDGTISFDPSKVTVNGTHRDFIVTVTVSAIVGGVLVTETMDLIYTVWAKQDFLTKPSFENVRIDRLDGDALNIVLSAGINRASTVSYDWGDGSQDSAPTSVDGIYTANHHFATVGVYTIVMTATTENGAVSNHYVKYDSGTGLYEVFDDDPNLAEGDGFPWWIVTLVLALTLLIIYLFVFAHPAIILIDAVCWLATLVLGVL